MWQFASTSNRNSLKSKYDRVIKMTMTHGALLAVRAQSTLRITHYKLLKVNTLTLHAHLSFFLCLSNKFSAELPNAFKFLIFVINDCRSKSKLEVPKALKFINCNPFILRFVCSFAKQIVFFFVFWFSVANFSRWLVGWLVVVWLHFGAILALAS